MLGSSSMTPRYFSIYSSIDSQKNLALLDTETTARRLRLDSCRLQAALISVHSVTAFESFSTCCSQSSFASKPLLTNPGISYSDTRYAQPPHVELEVSFVKCTAGDQKRLILRVLMRVRTF